MKLCRTCDEWKDESEFKKAGGWKCDECQGKTAVKCMRSYYKRKKKTITKKRRNNAEAAIYDVYKDIFNRCGNPYHKAYPTYGLRGIKCPTYGLRGIKCDFINFETFRLWAVVNNWKKGKHIHRLDSKGPYSFSNCVIVEDSEHRSIHKTKYHRTKAEIAADNKTVEALQEDYSRERKSLRKV